VVLELSQKFGAPTKEIKGTVSPLVGCLWWVISFGCKLGHDGEESHVHGSTATTQYRFYNGRSIGLGGIVWTNRIDVLEPDN